jgi:hypothetical protein
MKNLPNLWIGSLTTFDQVVHEIENCLSILKDNATEADFLDPKMKKNYSDDVMYMKQFFERAEYLARNP